VIKVLRACLPVDDPGYSGSLPAAAIDRHCARAAKDAVLRGRVSDEGGDEGVDLLEGGEREHLGGLRQQAVGVVVEEAQARVMEHARDEGGGHI
jgi:hypothetical protein